MAPSPDDRPLPRLTAARVPLTHEVAVHDADGTARRIHIPRERSLALYVDRRELVTLMTLGQAPELLALGYLLNQQLIADVREVESVTVDWEVGAAAVATRAGIEAWDRRIARRIVTSGCGQGTVFGGVLEAVLARRQVRGVGGAAAAPAASAAGAAGAAGAAKPVEAEALAEILDAMRRAPSVYREAGSVHGTALWRGGRMLVHIEDVGRHNAVDTVAGWMAMHGALGAGGGDTILYTTGRLTSEMVLKAAWLDVPVLVSRNGVTAMGFELAERLGLTLVGRASGQRWIVYTGAGRLKPFMAAP